MTVRAHERAWKALETRLGPSAPETVAALEALGQAYVDAQRPAKALDVHLRLLALREAALGPDAVVLAELLHRIGKLHQWRNGHRRARPFLERAVALRLQVAGADDPALGELFFDLGVAYGCAAPRRLADAEANYRRALAAFERAHGVEHWRVLQPLEFLADLLRVVGRTVESEATFARGLAICRAYPNPSDVEIGRLLAFLLRYALHLPGGTPERSWWERCTRQLYQLRGTELQERWTEAMARST